MGRSVGLVGNIGYDTKRSLQISEGREETSGRLDHEEKAEKAKCPPSATAQDSPGMDRVLPIMVFSSCSYKYTPLSSNHSCVDSIERIYFRYLATTTPLIQITMRSTFHTAHSQFPNYVFEGVSHTGRTCNTGSSILESEGFWELDTYQCPGEAHCGVSHTLDQISSWMCSSSASNVPSMNATQSKNSSSS
jgi:hypothetical protein